MADQRHEGNSSGFRSTPEETTIEYGSGGRTTNSNVDGPGVKEGTTQWTKYIDKFINK